MGDSRPTQRFHAVRPEADIRWLRAGGSSHASSVSTVEETKCEIANVRVLSDVWKEPQLTRDSSVQPRTRLLASAIRISVFQVGPLKGL